MKVVAIVELCSDLLALTAVLTVFLVVENLEL